MDIREIIEKEVNKAMESGLYSIAGLDMFDRLGEIKINDNLNMHLEYTDELLREYLGELMELKFLRPGLTEFLKASKSGDVRDNQSLEKENSFMIGLYSQMPRETAIDRLIRYYKNGKIITCKNLYALNNTLLYGTSSEELQTVRTCNNKFVGKFENGERIISYFPIDCKDINKAAERLVLLYNCRLISDGFDNVFFQPFLVHGLVATLQLFNDGNTRLGRVMQHSLMWQLINERTEFEFDLPPIYATRNYYPLRDVYRDKLV